MGVLVGGQREVGGDESEVEGKSGTLFETRGHVHQPDKAAMLK